MHRPDDKSNRIATRQWRCRFGEAEQKTTIKNKCTGRRQHPITVLSLLAWRKSVTHCPARGAPLDPQGNACTGSRALLWPLFASRAKHESVEDAVSRRT